SFPDLTPATFTVSVAAPGFKTWRQEKLTINSSEQRDLGAVTLTLGQITESVVVTAEAVAVNLATGDKSASFGSDELESLALRGRDIFDAVALMPGVIDTLDGRDAPGPTSIGCHGSPDDSAAGTKPTPAAQRRQGVGRIDAAGKLQLA